MSTKNELTSDENSSARALWSSFPFPWVYPSDALVARCLELIQAAAALDRAVPSRSPL